jgi:alanyl-tRNA synthetase
MYATVFEGSIEDGLEADDEAKRFWKRYLPDQHILYGSKKDNFWEMGASGPCGPCSEIHVDLRSEEDKMKVTGSEMVNKGHPLVIEIWNLVFIQYNRKKSGELELLPAKHIDTGMGFERLCMVVQGKKSNYDTDVFQPVIRRITEITGKPYGKIHELDVAMRVIADHLRAVSFSIADGQLPSNSGAGYVIRRILRRAVRYGYTFLEMKEPFVHKLLDSLIKVMGNAFNELITQKDIIVKVIHEEEHNFLRTLDKGIKLIDKVAISLKENNQNTADGSTVFLLYDTYGFPVDLTELILKEQGLEIDKEGFEKAMKSQKSISKDAAAEDKGDWVTIYDDEDEEFVGYDRTETEVKITRYRKIQTKGKEYYHLVFNITPFYPESGGQTGDTGYIESNGKKTDILDTQKEHNVIIHLSEKLPHILDATFKAAVNQKNRKLTMANHSATHLMHKALKEILGIHVEQKGSLVNYKHLRFDFSHFQKLTDEEILKVEQRVNQKIRENIHIQEKRNVPMPEAKAMGATALFGEKYGDVVRVIQFNDSIELCGGTHVQATGEIGFFKIISESAIAAGIRRIEAVTSDKAENYIYEKLNLINNIENLLKSGKNLKQSIEKTIEENKYLRKQLEYFEKEKINSVKQYLKSKVKNIDGINIIAEKIDIGNASQIKDIAFQLKGEIKNLFFIVGADLPDKVNLTVMISDNIVSEKKLNAGEIIKIIASDIKGSGGGQAYFASAGGTDASGIKKSLKKALEFIK